MKEKPSRWIIEIVLLRLLILGCWSIAPGLLHAQNLVPNPSFEIFDPCPPPTVGMGGPLEAAPWISPSVGTADYFNACADPMYRGVPINFQGYQPALTGVAYTGIYVYTISSQYREYITAPLLDTLKEDACYKASAWVNYSNEGCAADQFGILFSSDIPNPIGMFPQVAWAGSFLGDTVNWTNVLGYFIANGSELYITLGNCRTDPETQMDPACPGPYAYYYIDDVLVEEVPMEQVNVNLGADVAVCDSFTIVAGDDPDVVYIWNTGQQGPEITVYTSGTYSVTASYACTMEFDEIEVTIIQPIQVDIGPDTLLICEGVDYEISLDPDAGDYEWEDGSTDAEYTINTAGTYSVTLDNGCHLSSDTIEIITMDIPLSFSLGNDTIICDGEMFTIILDPTLGEFEWQDGSDDPTYSIDSDGTYSLTVSNMCGEQTDELEVEVIEPPTVFLGPDTAVLCPNDFIEFNLDPDMGDYYWQDGSSESSYTITEDGLYSVTVVNACGVENAQIVVVQVDHPEVDFGPDLQGCPGDTFTLAPWLGMGEYIWQDGSTESTFEVTTSGTYSLTITNECGIATDVVMVAIAPSIITPDLGPDVSICPGEVMVLSVASPSGSILWNDMSTADTLLVTSGGTYFVQVSTACESYIDTVVVTLNNNPPVVQLPPDFNLCQGDTATLDAGITGANFLWSDGSMSSQLSVSSPGLYAITVSNTCGASIDTILISAGEAAPIVSLGADTSLCNGDTVVITPAFTHVNSWTWHDGTSAPVFLATALDTVSIEVSNSCATAKDTLLTSLLPDVPTFDLGIDVEICPGENVTLSIAVLNVTILWSDGSSGPDLVVTDSATIFATISNVCGQFSDTLEVDLLSETPLLDLGQDQTICPGELITFDPGITGVSYLWHDGSTNATYQTTHEEIISLTITGVCGTSSDTVVLTESTDGPQVDLGPDIAACEGESVDIEAGISGVMYLWQDGSSLDHITVTQSGMYSLTVSNSCGSDTDTVAVVFSDLPPVQTLGPDTTLCEGITIVLTAQAAPGVLLEWQDMSSSMSYTVTQPGKYFVTAFNHCGSQSDTMQVSFQDAPDPFTLGPDTTICPGETVLLSSPSIFYDVLWQDGSMMLHLVANLPGTYWLQLSNECGATSDTLDIFVHQEISALDLEPELLWCPGDQFILDASQSFDATYIWSTGANTPSITVTTPGLYRVEVSSVCRTVEDQTDVIPEEDCGDHLVFYIPNVFSPNDDGINDVFSVHSNLPQNILSMEGSIFDRWGNLVYSSEEIPFVWDGRFAGEDMMPGVFVYTITVKFLEPEGERVQVLVGDVTLLR